MKYINKKNSLLFIVSFFICYINTAFSQDLLFIPDQYNPTLIVSSIAGTRAIIIEDYNGDNILDLAMVNSGTNNLSIFLGKGNGAFQAAVNYPVGTEPWEGISADFNGDGNMDLAITSSGANYVSILLNIGNGAFTPQVNYELPNSSSVSHGLTYGDYNKDGNIDLAVPVSAPSPNVVCVFLGIGNGTFQSPKGYAVGLSPWHATSNDFNNDGNTDLAVANEGNSFVSVLLGNGDGTFQTQQEVIVAGGNQGICSADFNNDGNSDIASACTLANSITILIGNGNGTFAKEVVYPVGFGNLGVTQADFNNDGKIDLASANTSSNDISILLGNGDGTFQNNLTYKVGAYPRMISDGDFNGDGKPDLAITDYGILLNNLLSSNNVITNLNCEGIDGIINLTGNGGMPPYQYSINKGVTFQSTGSFTGLTTGAYPVQVKDSTATIFSTTLTVAKGDTIPPVANIRNISIALDETGQAIITPDLINNNSTDNCSITSYTLDKTTFTCKDVGTDTVSLTVKDPSGNIASANALVTVIAMNALIIYPNPAHKGNITIALYCDSGFSYIIYNVLGQEVMQGSSTSQIANVNVDALSEMYLIEVTDAKGKRYTDKFIVH